MTNRREFIAGGLALLAPSILHAGSRAPLTGQAPLTIKQVIDLIQAEVPGGAFAGSVDTVKAGNVDQPVKGIVTTMFATDVVIAKAVAAGANFIIAHEPTFYNHQDDTSWLAGDKVVGYKKSLLEKHGIVVWRFHDGIHTLRPDGVLMGLLKAMGWDKYYNAGEPSMVTIPAISLKDIIERAKKALEIDRVRVIGDLSMSCQRVLVMPGAAGGHAQITMMKKYEPDVLITGEVAEWETAEYVRDARQQGLQRSLVVLGHAVSEEAGMEWMVEWLEKRVQGVKVTHIPSGSPFSFV